jgi:SAM-dependent methyltransferase
VSGRPAGAAVPRPPGVLSGLARCSWDPLAITRLAQRRAVVSVAGDVGGLVVDVGAGRQPHRDVLEARARRLVAVDIPGDSPTAEIDVWGDATALPLVSGCADTVTCLSAIWYVAEPRAAIAELARVLRPQGRLVLLAHQIRGESPEANDYWRFSRQGLELLAREAGFESVRVVATNGVFATTGQRFSGWMYEALSVRRRVPRWITRKLCALVLMPCWLLDQLDWGRQETLHWLLTAQRP